MNKIFEALLDLQDIAPLLGSDDLTSALNTIVHISQKLNLEKMEKTEELEKACNTISDFANNYEIIFS